MDERIRQHFNTIFAEAPKTRMALDLKQEMTQSAIDKYNDMVADGYSEEDAYQNVIDSIGDVTGLFPEVEEKNLFALPEKDRKKKAMLTACAVGLYIFAGAIFLASGMLSEGFGFDEHIVMTYGFVLAIIICIPPTVMLVYAANMYPGYTISISTFAWNVTWIIFLIAACVQKIVQLIFELRTEEKHL